MSINVLVCDDDPTRVEHWRSDIEGVLTETDGIESISDGVEYQVSKLEPAELSLALRGLTARQSDARTGASTVAEDMKAVLVRLDEADLLVVDHDLSPEDHAAATADLQGRSGEVFAQLARRFSSVGYIVLVNRGVQRTTFDLTMTRFEGSYADLNITDEELDRPALWWGATDEERPFRPSHWPLLSRVAIGVDTLIDSIDLKAPVLSTLGFTEEHLLDFAREQLDALGDDPWETTFDDVVTTPGLGLEVKDAQPDVSLRRRIAFFGVRRWLDRHVLVGQNVLIDLPHLLDRLPTLREGADLSGGAGPVDFLDADRARALIPRLSELEAFPGSAWLDRPAWLLSEVDYSSFEGGDDVDSVFCEDTMQFRPLDEVREFDSAVAGPYTQRYVEEVAVDDDLVEYRPRSRFVR